MRIRLFPEWTWRLTPAPAGFWRCALEGAENDGHDPDRQENYRSSLEKGHRVEKSRGSVHGVSFGRHEKGKGFIGI